MQRFQHDMESDRDILRRDQGSHLRGPPPPTICRQESKMYIVQPEVWKLLSRVVDTIVSEIFISGVLPFMSTWRLFSISADAIK